MTTTTLNHILVPTDFSETASQALRYASDLAVRLGARLTVVYCDPFLPPIDYAAVSGSWDEDSFAQLKARCEQQLAVDAALNIDPSVPYDVVVRVALPVEGILAQACQSDAALIVMGTHGRTGVRRLVIGSVTEDVTRGAEVPVLAIPPRSAVTSSIRVVVCPVIDRAHCVEALTLAAQLAPAEARFVVVRATPAEYLSQAEDDLRELREWIPSSLVARCELKLSGSRHVAEQISRLARNAHAELIVASEPAGPSSADVLHGTFAARLTQHSDCPVLTLNTPAPLTAARVTRQRKVVDTVWAGAA